MFTLLLQELNWKFAHQAMESLIKPNEENTERKKNKLLNVLFLFWFYSDIFLPDCSSLLLINKTKQQKTTITTATTTKTTPLESANLNIDSFQAFSHPCLIFLVSPREPEGSFFIGVHISGTWKISFICFWYFVIGEGDCFADCNICISFTKINGNMLVHEQEERGTCPPCKKKWREVF